MAGTDAGLRTFRVSRVRSVTVTDRPVERPEDFDLEEAWREVVEAMDERRGAVRARALADPRAIGWLRNRVGRHLRVGERRDDGRVEVEVGAWTHGAWPTRWSPSALRRGPRALGGARSAGVLREELVARYRAENPVTG